MCYLSNKKEWTDAFHTLGESQKYHAEPKQTDTHKKNVWFHLHEVLGSTELVYVAKHLCGGGFWGWGTLAGEGHLETWDGWNILDLDVQNLTADHFTVYKLYFDLKTNNKQLDLWF